MGLDILAGLLMWIAIKVQDLKDKEVKSSLDNWGWLWLQAILIGAAIIISKSNPFLENLVN